MSLAAVSRRPTESDRRVGPHQADRRGALDCPDAHRVGGLLRRDHGRADRRRGCGLGQRRRPGRAHRLPDRARLHTADAGPIRRRRSRCTSTSTSTTCAATEGAGARAGATKFDFQPNDDHCTVFADPVGHPFCLSTWDLVPGSVPAREPDVLLDHLDGQRRHVLGDPRRASTTPRCAARCCRPAGRCLGLVQHLTVDIERFWFRAVVAGDPAARGGAGPSTPGPSAPDVVAADVLAAYREEIDRADEIVTGDAAARRAGVVAGRAVRRVAARRRPRRSCSTCSPRRPATPATSTPSASSSTVARGGVVSGLSRRTDLSRTTATAAERHLADARAGCSRTRRRGTPPPGGPTARP